MAGGAFVVYRYIQNRQASANAAPVAVSTGVSPLDAGPYNITQSPALGTASSSAGAQTNADWITQAEQGLLSAGNDPLHILSALNDFVNGNPLSYQQQQIVNQAVTKYGPPPQTTAPIGPLSTAPVLSPPPGTVYSQDLSNWKVYQVQPDGTKTWLNPEQYALLGKPKVTQFQSDANVNLAGHPAMDGLQQA
jgi:hypothetical protein